MREMDQQWLLYGITWLFWFSAVYIFLWLAQKKTGKIGDARRRLLIAASAAMLTTAANLVCSRLIRIFAQAGADGV